LRQISFPQAKLREAQDNKPMRAKCFSISAPILLSALALMAQSGNAAQAKSSIDKREKTNRLIKIVDDSGKSGSFSTFTKTLIDKVQSRDRDFIEGTLSSSVTCALGGGSGKVEFNKQWDNLSKQSPFWARLERVLRHGFSRDKESGEWTAPGIVFPDYDGGDIRAVVWNQNVSLLSAPKDGMVLKQLAVGTVVTMLEPADASPINAEWVKIKTGEKTGYLRAADIFSAYDEYATFKLEKGKWRLTFFGVCGT
jgi:hypothetical protein